MSEEQLAKANKVVRAAQRETIKQTARERLKKIAKKKFTTTFIFALAQFEESFGGFWGHGEPEEKLSPMQKLYRAVWEQVRQNVLNNGNTQQRALAAELELHSVSYEGYRVDLRGKENDETGTD